MHNFQTWMEAASQKKIYMVRDPSPESELADILVEFDLNDPRHLINFIFGSISPDKLMAENPTFYFSKSEAERDANRRLVWKQDEI